MLKNTLALINTQNEEFAQEVDQICQLPYSSNLLCDSAQTRSIVKFGMNPYSVK